MQMVATLFTYGRFLKGRACGWLPLSGVLPLAGTLQPNWLRKSFADLDNAIDWLKILHNRIEEMDGTLRTKLGAAIATNGVQPTGLRMIIGVTAGGTGVEENSVATFAKPFLTWAWETQGLALGPEPAKLKVEWQEAEKCWFTTTKLDLVGGYVAETVGAGAGCLHVLLLHRATFLGDVTHRRTGTHRHAPAQVCDVLAPGFFEPEARVRGHW